MKFLKNILSIMAAFTIGSTNPMRNNSNNLLPQRPKTEAPQKPMGPTRPTVPAPQKPINAIATQPIPQNQQFNNVPSHKALPTPPSKQNQMKPTTNSLPPQRALPEIPLTPNLMESTTASSSTQDIRYNSLPPQRALPTASSTDMESTTASSSTQPRQPNKYIELLEIITTDMDPQNIMVNNRFTDQFMNFIEAQHLSDEDSAALLKAIADLYMTPTENETKNKQILLSPKNSITSHKKAPIYTNQEKPVTKKSFEKTFTTEKHFTTHNLIMLLDPEKEETLHGTARLLVQDALLALYEQAAPIIMSSNVLEIITHLRDVIGENSLQMLRNSNRSESFAQKLLTSYNLHENPLHVIILSLIDFNSKNFIFYFHRSEDLVLVIPQRYITDNIEDASLFNFQDQAKKCGFNPAVLTPIDDLSANNLLLQLKIQKTSQHKTTFIHNLTSLFIPQKRDGQLITPAETTPWIIYITGHGGAFYQSIGSIREQLDINKQNLVFYQEALHNNRKHHDAQQNIIIAEANIKKYEKILQGKSDWPDSQLVIGQANIAGTTMDDFSSIMEFFDHNLYVYYVHYTSCRDGGYKQTFVNETLSSLNVNFIVSTQGLDERNTQGVHLEVTFNSKAPYIVIAKKPFSAFFKVLKLFIDRPEEFVEAKRGKQEQEPFAYVLSAIVPEMNPQNQPFIRFPGVGVFGALSLGKNTKNITNTLVKAHEIENKPIDLSDANIKTIIITPSRINIPINFGNNTHCAIVSPTPSTIHAAHEVIHIFREISFEGILQALILNFISFNARIHTQTFIIKQLNSSNKTIHNLIIQIKNIPGQTMKAHIEIAFEFNNNMYQCAAAINNFDDPNLANFIYSLNFAPTTDIQSLSHKFLTSKEIKKLKQPITLEVIANFIDAKIDKQQPSLKETAVKKELTDFVQKMPK